MVAKAPGQHFAHTKEEAIKYAQNDTYAKGRGMIQKENVIFCVDMTEQAKKVGMFYEGSKFDDYIRHHFPNWNGVISNDGGGNSRELLEFDATNLDEDEIRLQLIEAIEKVSNENLIKPSKSYQARPYVSPLLRDDYHSNKLLLAGCPGSGKETSTLTLLINHHDRLWNSSKLNKNSLHVAIATIPNTTTELFKELSDVGGMWDEGVYYDYSRIKPYVLESFYKTYYSILNGTQKMWFKQNVEVVKKVEDIPQTHSKDVVPILMGSFQDIGMKVNGELKDKYKGLEDRIGILSIGEAHQFLSKSDNKMWSNIDSIKREFLMLITGTPYDYIFNEESRLYFKPEERGIFTWIDLMKEKHTDPNGPFGNYPDVNYYGLPNLKETILELKLNDLWEDDMNSFTYKKLFTTLTENGDFKYKDAILYLFKRLFVTEIDPFTNQSNGLSINSAPDLCDIAKRHMIITLPSGQDGVGVDEYVPLLTKLLKDSGILSEYKLLEVYKNGDVSDVFKEIEDDTQKTITFTCTKLLTGTNIPAWGSVIFLRPIGDSIKLFEQIIGRVKRPFESKQNCGVFVGNIDDVMSIEVSIAEKLSMHRGESKSFKEIATEVLKCYNIFTGNNGVWERLEFPDLESTLEELSIRGEYGVNSCIKVLKTPKDFNIVFKNKSKRKKSIDIVDNGKTKAKDRKSKRRKREKQLELFINDFKKTKNKDEYYRNMVKLHLSKIRQFCFINDLDSLQDAVKLIKTALKTSSLKNEIILEQIGKGVEFIPNYMLDNNQIDITYTNRWINKIKSDNLSIDTIIELLGESYLEEKESGYYHTPLWGVDNIINKLNEIELIENPIIFDPYGGKGTCLISFIKMYKSLGLKLDPSNIYYNDIDPIKVMVFKKLNKHFNLGIPKENIFCKDTLKTNFKMKPDYVIFNPPYNTNGGPNNEKDWNTHCQHQININKPEYIIPIIPNQAVSNKGRNGEKLRNTLKENGYGWIEAVNHKDSWFNANIETCHAIWRKNSDDLINPILLNEKIQKNPILESIERKVTGEDGVLPLKFLPLKSMNQIDRKLCNTIGHGQEILYSGDKIEWTTEPIEVDNKLKLVFPFSSSYHKIFKTKLPTGMLNHYLPLSSEEEGDLVKEYCLSKLFRLVAGSYLKTSGFTPFVKNKKIPDLRHKKHWSDEDLYNFFKLTQEERDFVNEH